MGKGDRRSLRGKLYRGSYGKSRNRDTNRPQRTPAPAPAAEGASSRS